MSSERLTNEQTLNQLGFRFGLVELPGEEAPIRWIVENVSPGNEEEIFTLEVFGEVLYASWPCCPSESVVFNLLEDLFRKGQGPLSNVNYSGKMQVASGRMGDYKPIYDLPLDGPMPTFEDYQKKVRTLEGPVGVIAYDTTVCDVIIDVINSNSDELGSTIAFRDSAGSVVVEPVLRRTSKWRSNEAWEPLQTLIKSQIEKTLEPVG